MRWAPRRPRAQLIIEKIANCKVTEVTELPDTLRGQGGFGSTGSNINIKPEAPKDIPGRAFGAPRLSIHGLNRNINCSGERVVYGAWQR